MDAKTKLAIGGGAKASDLVGLIKGSGRVAHIAREYVFTPLNDSSGAPKTPTRGFTTHH